MVGEWSYSRVPTMSPSQTPFGNGGPEAPLHFPCRTRSRASHQNVPGRSLGTRKRIWPPLMPTFNLIDGFNYYLILTFVVSTTLRIRNYRAILGFIFAFPNRWPRLLDLVKQYRAI